MKLTIQRHEKYKDSSVEWIGEIPQHWEVSRIYDVAIQRKIKNIGLPEKNLFSLSYGKIIRKDIDSHFGLLPESFETYQIIEKGNIILRLIDLQNDQRSLRVGLVKEKGIITSAYLCLQLLKKVNPTFTYYLLYSFDISKVFYWFGGGLRQSMKFDDVKVIPFILPSLTEQEAIADYLDTKTAQIDRKIDLLTQKAQRYEELKRAIVNETVTRGLDKSVPMKDSGIEWIGKIPEHWEIKRLKDLGFLYSGLTGKAGSDFTDEHQWSCDFIPFVNIANNQYISLSDMKKVIVTPQEKQNQVKKDDLFFLMSSENYEDIGKTALLRSDIRATYLNSFCKGFRFTIKKIVPNFANYLLASQKYRDCFAVEGKGFTRINLKIEKVNNLFFLLPPLHEQVKIAEYLDQKTNYIDQIIENFYSQIEIQKELRKTLINDVVTGKIKVA